MKNLTRVLILAQAISLSASAATVPVSSTAAPSDYYFPKQWALKNDASQDQQVMIDRDNLHTFMQPGVAGVDIGYVDAQDEVNRLAKAPVIVAVIDSGLDQNHEDLVGRVAPDGFDFLTNSPATPLPVPSGSPVPMGMLDDMGHGTHVSGIIAANSGNGIGIAGIAPSTVKILPLRILAKNFVGFSYQDPTKSRGQNKLISDFAADAINYAVAHHASIINLSLGWPKIVDTANARKSVQNAIQAGVLVVVAAGNDQKNDPTYPCAYEGVICVGATTNTGQMAIFSDTGGVVDILAPGDGIYSLYPGATSVVPKNGKRLESIHSRIQGYEILSGTSQASPMVAAVAAVLKSAYPNISMNELKARLLSSGAALPTADAALYGNIHLKHALDAQPQPVYLPNFKPMGEVVVDEKSLSVSGQVAVTNLWLPANGVSAQITVNGKSAGSIIVDAIASGQSFSVPWQYTYGSLEEPAALRLNLTISDKNGTSKEFAMDLSAERAVLNMSSTKIVAIPPTSDGTAPNWLINENGYNFLNMNKVGAYALKPGLPIYYVQPTDNRGRPILDSRGAPLLELFDPSKAPSPIALLNIPGVYFITQVLHMDVNRDGHMDWVVVGTDANSSFLQFSFMNEAFQPLWGTPDTSTWRTTSAVDQAPFHNMMLYSDYNTGQRPRSSRSFSSPGTWLQSNGKLVPCFFATGKLPDSDNWDEFDNRNTAGSAPGLKGSDTHFYCLIPQAISGGITPLQIHALDNKDVRTKFPTIVLRSLLPQSLEDERQGHAKVIFTLGNQVNAQTFLWNFDTIASTTYPTVNGWDLLASSGTPFSAISTASTENSSAFINYFDTERGSIAWATPDGQYIDRSEFSFFSPENPLQNTTGIFDLPNLGRYWFLETQFNLVAFHQAPGKTDIETQTLPLERDSTFPGGVFSEMFTPITVGTTANPEPGIYINSTTVRGNQVSVAVWNPADGKFEKPLRYSLQIPDGCSQSDPFHSTEAVESFSIPLFCNNANHQLEMQIVSPAQ
jgi:subtilisin family serine protease